MQIAEQKNRMGWVLAVFVAAAAVLLFGTVLNNSSPDDIKPAATLGGDDQQGEAAPSETKPAEATRPPETATEPLPVDEPLREPLKDRTYSSTKPLYFRVVFGEDGTNLTLGVVDELGGTGAGYNVAYVDENRNGDLTDDAAKKFPKYERGSRAGQTDPRFNFSGPFKDRVAAQYSLNLYTLGRKESTSPGDHYFFWTLDTDGWNYFFINGKARLSSSAAEALAGPPIRLAGPCKWQISSARKSGKATVSAGLKDENGCTLRIVRGRGVSPVPGLSLIKDGKVELEENMKFG